MEGAQECREGRKAHREWLFVSNSEWSDLEGVRRAAAPNAEEAAGVAASLSFDANQTSRIAS